MYKRKPLFVVFEGVEGSGKSFQARRLYNKLKKKSASVILTREPGGTKSSELIRNLILKDYFNKEKSEKFDKYTDTLLYLAARNEHIKNKIKPALIKNKIVICDRFTDSTIAYQVYGKKIKMDFIKNIHRYILSGVKPNLTFLLKVSSKTSSKRLKKRKTKNRYDNFSRNFYKNVQRSFLKIASKKKNYYILDNSKNSNLIEERIFNIVSKYLKKK